MATSKHFPVQRYTGAPNDIEICYDPPVNAFHESKTHNNKHTKVNRRMQPTSSSSDAGTYGGVNPSVIGFLQDEHHNSYSDDPYTSVTSFKSYKRLGITNENSGVPKTNLTGSPGAEANPNESKEIPVSADIDNTVVSAYDYCIKSPMLFDRQRLVTTAQQSEESLNRKSKMESNTFDCTIEYDDCDSRNSDTPHCAVGEMGADDKLARTFPMKSGSFDDACGQLRNTIGHLAIPGRESESPDSGSVSPASGNSRPNSAGGRRRLPTVPKRSIFDKTSGNLSLDSVPKPLELTIPKTFKKENRENHESIDDTDNKIRVIEDKGKTKLGHSDESSDANSDEKKLGCELNSVEMKAGSDDSTEEVKNVTKPLGRKPKSLPDRDMVAQGAKEKKYDKLNEFTTKLIVGDPHFYKRTLKSPISDQAASDGDSGLCNGDIKTKDCNKEVSNSNCEAKRMPNENALDLDVIDDSVTPDMIVPRRKSMKCDSDSSEESLPPHSFFSFNHSVIQQLTDSVMDKMGSTGKFEVSLEPETIEEDELQILNDMDKEIDKAAKIGNESFSNSESDCSEMDVDKEKDPSSGDRSPSVAGLRGKLAVEGKSFSGRESDFGNKRNNKIDCNIQIKVDEPNQFYQSNSVDIDKENKGDGRAKVERSPSYRKRVMARAKNRYSKKSSMHKECSCVRNENGDIIVCQFCENYELRKKNRSMNNLATVDQNKCYRYYDDGNDMDSYSSISSPRRALTPNGLPPLPVSNSPRPLRKVQVSSRVDVLMSSDLFRKHLHRHEYLLQKHMHFRRTGMRKSVSSLDLTEGFVVDSDSDSVHSSINTENDNGEKYESRHKNGKGRRHSLTGDSDKSTDNFMKTVHKKKPFSTLPKSHGRSRPAIPSFSDNTSNIRSSRSNYIPSFHEFKKLKENKTSDISSQSKQETRVEDFSEDSKIEIDKEKADTKDMTANILESETDSTLPLQLQVITESSGSQEQLLNVGVKDDTSDLSDNPKQAMGNSSQTEKTNSRHSARANDSDNATNATQSVPATVERYKSNSSEGYAGSSRDSSSDKVKIPKTAPSEKLKQRVRPKPKPRILPKTDLESESQAFSDSNDRVNLSVRERRRPGYKRPRSLISKKSSLEFLIQQTEGKDCSSDIETKSSIKERPKLKVRSRSESRNNLNSPVPDTKQVVEQSRNHLAEQNSLTEKGSNSLSQRKQEIDCCSPFDIGESETSTSVAGSLSDSIRSEVNVDETSESVNEADDTCVLSYDKEVNPKIQGLPDVCSSDEKVEKQASHDSDKDSGPPNGAALDEAKTAKLPSDTDVGEEKDAKPPGDTDECLEDESEQEDVFKEEQTTPVLRSTSDACKITQEAARKKRERKERPYKSDPFSGTEMVPASKRCALNEEKAKLRQRLHNQSSSKDEIMTFLDGVKQADLVTCDSFPSLEELNEDDEQIPKKLEDIIESPRKVRKNWSNVSSLSTDSGVIGQDGSHDSQQSSPSNTLSHSQSERLMPSWHTVNRGKHISASCSDLSKAEVDECADCRPAEKKNILQTIVCPQCHHRRIERKEIIQEIVETEINYGRDLNLLKEEFYKPMMKTGLLNKEQLDAIFLNLDELLHVNKHFITKLKSAINSASQNNDQDLQDVMIGCLFLESSTMFLTFENYCVNQAQAPVLLEQFEREKELLRIFLQASQKDNQQLRKLHLKAFLMVPVQRIMKYPLLLDRLYKTTPDNHTDKDSLRVAKEKIEDILGYINAKSKSASIQQRKPSTRKVSCSVSEKIEVSRVALLTLHWNRKDVCDVITSQLQVTQPADHLWATKKCKNYKFTTVYGVLLTLSQTPADGNRDNCDNENFLGNASDNNNTQVKSAAVVFIKEKNGRYQALREPFMLEKCIVSQDPEYMDVFEIIEWNKEAYLIKAETPHETKLWVQNLRQQMKNLGCWRKRRNALPNILLNHLQ